MLFLFSRDNKRMAQCPNSSNVSAAQLVVNNKPSQNGILDSQSKPNRQNIPNVNTTSRTLTRKFFCLASCEQRASPTRALKDELQNAGLGEKRICFRNSSGNAAYVMQKLQKHYPKLQHSGGFDILKRGKGPQVSELVFIPPPPTGYNVEFLRKNFSQGTVYLRPREDSLDTTSVAANSSEVSSQNIILL